MKENFMLKEKNLPSHGFIKTFLFLIYNVQGQSVYQYIKIQSKKLLIF